MAEAASMTVLAVYPHKDILEKYHYLIRESYQKWTLNPNALQDPLLTAILSLEVEFYREDGVVRARKRE